MPDRVAISFTRFFYSSLLVLAKREGGTIPPHGYRLAFRVGQLARDFLKLRNRASAVRAKKQVKNESVGDRSSLWFLSETGDEHDLPNDALISSFEVRQRAELGGPVAPAQSANATADEVQHLSSDTLDATPEHDDEEDEAKGFDREVQELFFQLASELKLYVEP